MTWTASTAVQGLTAGGVQLLREAWRGWGAGAEAGAGLGSHLLLISVLSTWQGSASAGTLNSLCEESGSGLQEPGSSFTEVARSQGFCGFVFQVFGNADLPALCFCFLPQA